MKKNTHDLVIFGGHSTFPSPLHVGRPNIGERESFYARVNTLLDAKQLTNNGAYVQQLEKKIIDYLGVKHCIATCNGTMALMLVVRALGLHGEIILPAMTAPATPHALQWQQIVPKFCDISPHSHNINPDRVKELISPQTSAIIAVHLWGQPCEVEKLIEIAHENNLKLLFDAAHAFGCSYKETMLGNFGEAEILSFHATKFFHTFEGGAVVTNNAELAEKIRRMRNFGFAGEDNVVCLGINGKMHEVSAAMGLTNLEQLEEIITINRKAYHEYKINLENVPGIKIISYNEQEQHNYQYIVIEVDETISGIKRDQLQQILRTENVLARRYFYPGCHRIEPYRSTSFGIYLPETEKVVNKVLCLPGGTSISIKQIKAICQIIHFVVDNSQAIVNAMDTVLAAHENGE